MFRSIQRAHEVLLHGFWRKRFQQLSSPANHQIPQLIKTLQGRFRPQAGQYLFSTQEQWEQLAREVIRQSKNLRQPRHLVKLRDLQENWKEDLARAIDTEKSLHAEREAILAQANEEIARSLQQLCREGVFHQGHSWSCRECSYKNWTAIEALKVILECQVCRQPQQLPIDITFDFRMNDFLATCLREHDTLSVVWALRELSARFECEPVFVPQTALYRKHPDHQGNAPDRELDLLCTLNGRLVFGEVKASLAAITNSEMEQLIGLAREYRPEIVVICAMNGDQALLKTKLKQIREQLGDQLTVEGFVGQSEEKLEFHLP